MAIYAIMLVYNCWFYCVLLPHAVSYVVKTEEEVEEAENHHGTSVDNHSCWLPVIACKLEQDILTLLFWSCHFSTQCFFGNEKVTMSKMDEKSEMQ